MSVTALIKVQVNLGRRHLPVRPATALVQVGVLSESRVKGALVRQSLGRCKLAVWVVYLVGLSLHQGCRDRPRFHVGCRIDKALNLKLLLDTLASILL